MEHKIGKMTRAAAAVALSLGLGLAGLNTVQAAPPGEPPQAHKKVEPGKGKPGPHAQHGPQGKPRPEPRPDPRQAPPPQRPPEQSSSSSSSSDDDDVSFKDRVKGVVEDKAIEKLEAGLDKI